MPAPIAILEDNEGRRAAMRGELDRGLPGSAARFFDNAPDMIRWLADNVATLRLISLDHDLGPSRERDGEPFEPGTGRDVADWLTSVRPVCPVLIHTSNAVDAQGMRFALEDAGWRTVTVVPSWGDGWIRESWLPRAAELLRLGSGDP